MAESLTLKVEPRTAKGGRDAAKLRATGRVPAVIYGHKEAAVHVTAPLTELQAAIRHHAHALELHLEGKSETVLIQEVQHCHLGREILHVDFRRVSADEMVVVLVPVELKGIAVGQATGVLDQPLHQIHVKCPALRVPEAIRVNIEKLQLGQSIHVRELVLPENVTAMESPEAIVVQIKARSAEVLVPTGPAGEGANEPEVITAKKKVEEDEK